MDNLIIRANNMMLRAEQHKLDGKHIHTIAQQICIIRALLKSIKRGDYGKKYITKNLNKAIKILEKIL